MNASARQGAAQTYPRVIGRCVPIDAPTLVLAAAPAASGLPSMTMAFLEEGR